MKFHFQSRDEHVPTACFFSFIYIDEWKKTYFMNKKILDAYESGFGGIKRVSLSPFINAWKLSNDESAYYDSPETWLRIYTYASLDPFQIYQAREGRRRGYREWKTRHAREQKSEREIDRHIETRVGIRVREQGAAGAGVVAAQEKLISKS